MPTTLPNMGLTSWPSGTDQFDHTALANNWTAVDNHDHSSGKGLQIPTAGLQNLAVTNGKIAADAVDAGKILDGSVGSAELGSNAVTTVKITDSNVTTAKIADANVTTAKIADANVTAAKLADAARLGLSDLTSVRRGKSIVSTLETLTAPSGYQFAPTPDLVSNIVLPTDGLIAVLFNGMWQSSATTAVLAGIFLGSNQATIAPGRTNYQDAPQAQAASLTPGVANKDAALSSYGGGLISETVDNVSNQYTGPVTTGQIAGLQTGGGSYTSISPLGVGGPCYIFAAAGTYSVGIKYAQQVSGNITVKNRKLWVWTLAF